MFQIEHALQNERQTYLATLRDNISAKMKQMREDAVLGDSSEQTFQRWLSDRLVESSNYLSLQFTEEVLSRSWLIIQELKLNKLTTMLNPIGRNEVSRNELR